MIMSVAKNGVQIFERGERSHGKTLAHQLV